MKNIEILINDKKKDFSYAYKIEQIGKNIIKYIFKQPKANTNYMFCDCSFLTKIDLSNFNTQNVTNMSNMFSRCSSLTIIDLSNFNTQKVTDMSNMFRECSSLTNIDLDSVVDYVILFVFLIIILFFLSFAYLQRLHHLINYSFNSF